MGTEPDYTISCVIVAKDASMAGAQSAQRQIGAVEKAAERAGSRISQMFAVIGGAAGIGATLKGIISINSGLQDTTNGMATLYSAMTGADIGRSFRAAQVDIRGLAEDARRGVGELENYTDAYQRILGPGLAAGASRETLRTLTRNAIGATGAAGRPLWQAGMDVQQALTTGASQRVTPIVALALSAVKTTEEAFNKLKPAQKIAELNRAFLAFSPGITLMGQSWSAQSATFTDSLKVAVRLVTSPIFEHWTKQLREANGWLERNQDRIASIAETWGVKLVAMWDTLIARAGTYAALAGAAYAAPGLLAAGRGAGAAMGGIRGWGAATLMPALRDPFGMAKMFGAAGATGGIGNVIMGLVGGATKLVAPLAILSTAFLAVRGAVGEFPAALDYVRAAGGRFMDGLSAVGLGFDSLTSKGSALNIVGAGLIYTFGGIIDVIGVFLRVVGTVALGIGLSIQLMGDRMNDLWRAAHLDFSPGVTPQERFSAAGTTLSAMWGGGDDRVFKKDARHAWNNADLPSVTSPGDTIFNGPVTVNVKTEINNDPARVVDAWQRGIDRVKQAALQSQRLPTLAGA